MKFMSVLAMCAALLLMPAGGFCSGERAALPSGSGWEVIPAGGRSAYKGIHGGTMPVSLLVSADGMSLLTFVGRTGNDFLELLRETDVPLPSLLNATMTAEAMNRGPRLLAGGPNNAMPVLPMASGAGNGRDEGTPLTHFGLSANPLAIEGAVERPENASQGKKYRISFNSRFFQPRRPMR